MFGSVLVLTLEVPGVSLLSSGGLMTGAGGKPLEVTDRSLRGNLALGSSSLSMSLNMSISAPNVQNIRLLNL